MKSVLILGVGGTGSRAVNMLQKKINRMGMQEDVNIVSVVLDTNAADEKNIDTATIVSLSDNANVKTIRERLGAACEDFFPADSKFDNNNIAIGAGQWRKQSYLAFMNAMNGDQQYKLTHALEKLADKTSASTEFHVFTVASLAGGTGSGSFIPLTFYVKKRLRELFGENSTIRAKAMLACPDIYESSQNDPQNVIKIYANAYAILRELNAINQVVYGANTANYDNGSGEVAGAGRTPVRFHLGTPDSPVGVLFDSQDPRFQTTEAAPFDTVFMMEKITNVSSVVAHDEAMANILYSLICTKAGGELNGIWSNEESKYANEKGHNRKYAGIGSCEIQYPVEELIEYFAWRKTQDDAEGSWLVLHNATEKQIAEKREQAKRMRKEYHLSVRDYSKLFIDAQEAEARTETCNVTELIRSSTTTVEIKDDKPVRHEILDDYWKKIKENLASLIPDHETVASEISGIEIVENAGLLASKSDKEGKAYSVCEMAQQIYGLLDEYYQEVVDTINSQLSVTTDTILPMDVKNDPRANLDYSFVEHVLMKDGYYVHPVAAMLQLCRFRLKLQEELSAMKGNEWKAVGAYEIGKLPSELISCTEDIDALELGSKTGKSAYLKGGAERFYAMLDERAGDSFKTQKTDYSIDSQALLKDGDMILTRLHNEAGEMLLRRVIEKLTERVEALIESYRSFFARFAEQKDRMKSDVEKAEKEKSGSADTSCVYVGASIATRRAHYERMKEESITDEREAGDVAGKGVFDTAYKMSCAKKGTVNDDERVDASGVFKAMYAANLAQLGKTDYCLEMRRKNVLQVIAEENKNASAAGQQTFSTAYVLAKPALQVTTGEHKNQAVVLVPKSVEEYLQKNATLFEIEPSADCAGSLIHGWCKEALVRTEEAVPKNTIFICRALMSVDPVEIVKVNEMSGEAGYYSRYLEAVRIGEEQNNDSMLPHLGFNWHKRGYLPFINPALEKAADKQMVKALLYAIMNAEISFSAPYGDKAFRHANEKIAGNGKFADENNLLAIIEWLRPQDDKIKKWSKAFDLAIEEQLEKLPRTGFVSDIGASKTALTMTDYLKQLRTNIFSEMLKNSEGKAQNILADNLNLSIIEFAKRIKVEEEARGGFDCNDAEKILLVASDLLWELCERVVSSEEDMFREVYQWELDYFIAELCVDEDFNKAESMKKATNIDEAIAAISTENVRELLHFANRAGAFMEIEYQKDPALAAKSKWEKVPFNFNNFLRERRDRIRKVLEYHGIKFNENKAANAPAPAEAPAESVVAETVAPAENN